MPLTYTSYTATLANLLVEQGNDTNFQQILPSIIDYAEGRIYRDLDLLSTVVSDQSASVAVNSRTFTLPIPAAGAFNIVDQVNIVENGVRTPLTPVSRDVLDMIWPSSISIDASSRPQVFATANSQSILVGPVSGAIVTLEVVGRVKPTPLSSSNPTTYLTTQLPDLFLAASMVFASGYQKNFGNTADDSGSAVSWESQYKLLLAGADMNAAQEAFAGASWTSKRVEPYAQPQRG